MKVGTSLNWSNIIGDIEFYVAKNSDGDDKLQKLKLFSSVLNNVINEIENEEQ